MPIEILISVGGESNYSVKSSVSGTLDNFVSATRTVDFHLVGVDLDVERNEVVVAGIEVGGRGAGGRRVEARVIGFWEVWGRRKRLREMDGELRHA